MYNPATLQPVSLGGPGGRILTGGRGPPGHPIEPPLRQNHYIDVWYVVICDWIWTVWRPKIKNTEKCCCTCQWLSDYFIHAVFYSDRQWKAHSPGPSQWGHKQLMLLRNFTKMF